MALTPMTRASLGPLLSCLLLTLLTSTIGAQPFNVVANDTIILNLDTGCISIGSSTGPTGGSQYGGDVGSSPSTSGGSSRRLLREGDVRSQWGGKHNHGVVNDPIVLAPQPKCPVWQTIATQEPGEFLLTPDGGTTCIGLSQYANPAMYLARGDKNTLDELIPLQRVSCNPGCVIPNVGCGIPFTFNECTSAKVGCVDISVKGNLPYGNGGLMRTAEWATSLVVQPIIVEDPYNKEHVEFQVQPNNTQIYLGHKAPTGDPLYQYNQERAKGDRTERKENRTEERTERDEWRKENRTERVDDVVLANNKYARLQVWSVQCITCKELIGSTGAGLRTSAAWELVPGGTNPMGAPQMISVSHGVSQENSESQTTSTTHTHSVSLAISNAVMFGFQIFGFVFSDTFTHTTTTTNTVSQTVANEISQSTTSSTSSTFTQACPSSSSDFLKNNQGYEKGVAMWQWVVRAEYQLEEQCATPWATYWSHHVVCTYGDVPKTYGPPPKCPPTYCKGGVANNCQECSSYAWMNQTSSPPPNDPLTTNPYESPGALERSQQNATQDSTGGRRQGRQIAQEHAGTADTTGGSGGSNHIGIIIGFVAGVVGAGAVAGVVFAVYRKHAQRQQNGLQQSLIETQV